MKRFDCRLVLCLMMAMPLLAVAGCQSSQMSDKPGGDMNSAMTAQQKAVIAEHKKKGEQ